MPHVTGGAARVLHDVGAATHPANCIRWLGLIKGLGLIPRAALASFAHDRDSARAFDTDLQPGKFRQVRERRRFTAAASNHA